ncbi:MAG: cation transporting ATPase C-terminal domain-containing protein, partial [Candidatus Obscuribacterales bacterium]|nr:cation transporting ATPase C-terminal domain-containing protein [Candidatus Obscuribacterales bacterium]
MGKSGTDLAREAANMVITDDNFSTIVKAIRQGRVIYENIRRAICYLLTASVASVLTVASAIIIDGTLAMTPLQLLWLNLIMHIFPGLGIVMQEAAPGIMQRPPRDPKASLLGGFEKEQILMRALMVSLSVLVAIHITRVVTGNEMFVTTVAFTTISLSLLLQAWSWLFVNAREGGSYQRVSINKFMYLSMLVSYALIAVAIYMPGLQMVLNTVALEIPCLTIAASMSILSYAACLLYDLLRAKLTEKRHRGELA